MKEKLVQALRGGHILAVDWADIEEMLGELSERPHDVCVCSNDEVFPPVEREWCQLSELDIHEVLRQAGSKWLADVHDPEARIPPLGRIRTRYFSAAAPKSSGPWVETPGTEN